MPRKVTELPIEEGAQVQDLGSLKPPKPVRQPPQRTGDRHKRLARKRKLPSPKQAAHLEKARPISITLKNQHRIIMLVKDKKGEKAVEVIYGPGEVKVRPTVAKSLLAQEQHLANVEMELQDPNRAFMIQVTPRGNRRVAVDPTILSEEAILNNQLIMRV